jgi:HEPN domain-containing protein
MDKKKKLIADWIDKAEHDLGMAELAKEHKPEYKDMICFHCQQAAEKYLKAGLIQIDCTFKKTHSLVYLLDLLVDQDSEAHTLYPFAEVLEDYGVEVRYPGEQLKLTEQDVEEAYDAALKIKEVILKFIAK